MPSICRFGGIVIYMYYFDHPPPHFHSVYQGVVAQIGINPVVVLIGSLPPAQLKSVLQWARKRQADLMADWQLAQGNPASLPPLQQIQP